MKGGDKRGQKPEITKNKSVNKQLGDTHDGIQGRRRQLGGKEVIRRSN